jgi:hypothetical protein
LFGNRQPALLKAGLVFLDATQLCTQLDQLLVVAGLRGERGRQLRLPRGEPVDLPLQAL